MLYLYIVQQFQHKIETTDFHTVDPVLLYQEARKASSKIFRWIKGKDARWAHQVVSVFLELIAHQYLGEVFRAQDIAFSPLTKSMLESINTSGQLRFAVESNNLTAYDLVGKKIFEVDGMYIVQEPDNSYTLVVLEVTSSIRDLTHNVRAYVNKREHLQAFAELLDEKAGYPIAQIQTVLILAEESHNRLFNKGKQPSEGIDLFRTASEDGNPIVVFPLSQDEILELTSACLKNLYQTDFNIVTKFLTEESKYT